MAKVEGYDELQACIDYSPTGRQSGIAKCRNPKPNAYEGTGTTSSQSYKPWCYTQEKGFWNAYTLKWGYCDVGEPYIPCW